MPGSQMLQTYLRRFRERFEPALKTYLTLKIKELEQIDHMAGTVASITRDFTLQGGKRLRAALVAIGYRSIKGEEPDAILQPAIATELLHTFFLIHDDVIDRSSLRRNNPTVHQVFRRFFADKIALLPEHSQEHFAHSLAVLAGDMCCAISYEALSKSAFPADRILKSIHLMHEVIDCTMTGQVLDVVYPLEQAVSEDNVLQIQRLKTAKYSFEGPLVMGLTFANADENILQGVRAYANDVGIAFQIQDDILGLFGSEEEVGKPVSSDIEEGKQTLLTVTAMARSSDKQRQRLRELIGKQGITDAELGVVQDIVRETGALNENSQRALWLSKRAQQTIADLPIRPDVRLLLHELANYVVERQK